MIPTEKQREEFDAVEDILMVGYPNGIWDQVNNQPIVRKGITATHPALDYDGRKEFMIDAACFPGSSGSPVLLFNQSGYRAKSGKFIMGPERLILLGILRGGHQQTVTGEIKVIDVPSVQNSISLSSIPINLGIVIKSERMIEMIIFIKDTFKL